MNEATTRVILVFGLIMSIAGVEHGIGELTQGAASVPGVVIRSWGESRFFSQVGGEPAMTLLPDMRSSGLLSILVSVAIAGWSLFFLQRKHSGLVLALLSVLLLLVGGGFAPPLIGLLLGILGSKLGSSFPLMRRNSARASLRLLARLWPFSLCVGTLCFLYLVPVSSLVWGFWGIATSESAVVSLALTAFAMIIVSAISAYAHDAIKVAD